MSSNITDLWEETSVSHVEGQVCNIYLWETASSMLSFGHISLELPNKVYISFWPDTETGKCDMKHEQGNSKCFKTFHEETEEKGYPNCTLEVQNLNITAISEWWNTFSNQDPKYNVWKQNCASVVLDALSQGNPWFKGFGYVKTPKAVFRITQHYVKNEQVTNSCLIFQYVCLCMFRYFLLLIYKVYCVLHHCLFENIHLSVNKFYDWFKRIFVRPQPDSDKSSTDVHKVSHITEPLDPRTVTVVEEQPEAIAIGGTEIELDEPNLPVKKNQ